MCADAETARLLGEIKAGQDHIRTSITDIHDVQRDLVEATSRIERETRESFGEVKAEQAITNERLAGHMQDDDRRFEGVQSDIDRAHQKIARGTAETSYGEPLPRQGASTGQKAGIWGGVVAAIGIVAAAIAKALGGGGDG